MAGGAISTGRRAAPREGRSVTARRGNLRVTVRGGGLAPFARAAPLSQTLAHFVACGGQQGMRMGITGGEAAAKTCIVRLKKTDHLNFDFTKTLPTPSILIAQ